MDNTITGAPVTRITLVVLLAVILIMDTGHIISTISVVIIIMDGNNSQYTENAIIGVHHAMAPATQTTTASPAEPVIKNGVPQILATQYALVSYWQNHVTVTDMASTQ